MATALISNPIPLTRHPWSPKSWSHATGPRQSCSAFSSCGYSFSKQAYIKRLGVFDENGVLASIFDDDGSNQMNWKSLEDIYGNRLAAIAVDAISKAYELLLKAAVASVVMAALFLVSNPYLAAMAASGGRMGGKSFSSRSSSSSSSRSSSSSYRSSSSSSRTSSSSWGGGSTSSSSKPSSSYSSWGGSSSSSSRPSSSSWGSSSSSSSSSPRKSSTSSTWASSSSYGASSYSSPSTATSSPSSPPATPSPAGSGADPSSTKSSPGLSSFDWAVIMFWFHFQVEEKRSIDDAEMFFNELSVEERGKIDEETLVNVDNTKARSTSIKKDDGLRNEYMVVTIVVAGENVPKLPPINESKDLKEALEKLASLPTKRTVAVEVLLDSSG